MKLPYWLSKKLVIGVVIETAAVLLYIPITNYLYYGGGWPFVQVFFLIFYCIGSNYIFKSKAPTLIKLLLVFWWVVYGVIVLAIELLS